MKAVMKIKPGTGVEIKNVSDPKLKEGEVLVKVKYGSICGTDISIYDWTPWVAGKITPPIVIGHEIVGEIIDINGEASNLKIGDIVSSETHIFDGTCGQCKKGNYHVCENVTFFGYQRDGGFAEYATIPITTTWKNDPRIPLRAMSVQEPLGNSVHTVTKGNVKGKKVLVVGLGPTGLCACAVAKAYGAHEIIGIDPIEYRRNLTEEFVDVKTMSKFDETLSGKFDVVLEMSGHRSGLKTCFDAVSIAGKIVALGIPKDEVMFDWGKYIIDKEISIEGVFGRKIWETWHQTTELLTTGKIDLTKIITHEFLLDDFDEAMAIMKSGKSGKILLKIG